MIGGLIVHLAAQRRDVANDRRKQRVDYLVTAYRSLARATNREFDEDRAGAFETAISDIILLGSPDQMVLARKSIDAFATDGGADLDELLLSLRSSLRAELGLEKDTLDRVPTVRIVLSERADSPLTLRGTQEIMYRRVETATARAVEAASVTPCGVRPPVTEDNNAILLPSDEPAIIIRTAYDGLRDHVAGLLSDNAVDTPEGATLTALADVAVEHALIAEAGAESIRGLEKLYQLALQDNSIVNQDRAREFTTFVDVLIHLYPRDTRETP